MNPDRREILERVAAGDLSPDEAEELLDSARRSPSGGDASAEGPLRKLKVAAGFGSIVIAGDLDVAEAHIDGHHSAALEGDTLIVHADIEPLSPGLFSMHFHDDRYDHRERRREARRARRRSRSRFPSTLRIRVNPSIEVDAKLDAGPLHISRIDAPVRARSSAGPITIEEVVGPLDVAVNAGAIRIDAKLTDGESRVRSDAGAVRVDLHPESSVRVVAQAALGKVVLPGTEEYRRGLGSMQEAIIGGGAATLRVDTAMGSINVTTRGGSPQAKAPPPASSDAWTESSG